MQRLVESRAENSVSAQNGKTIAEIFPGGLSAETLWDERTEKIIGCYAMRLVRSGAFMDYEMEDAKQELRCTLLLKMPKFDPSRQDRYGYAAMVVDGSYKNMLKGRDRKLKRCGGRLISLQHQSDDCEESFANTISVDDYEMTMGGQRIPSSRRGDFDEALNDFWSKLSEEDFEICQAFMEYGSAEAASRHIGKPARTILWRLKHTIFEAASTTALVDFYGGAM